MITLGLDIGSLFSKAVVLDGDDIIGERMIPTTGNVAREIPTLMADAIKAAGLTRDRIECVGATGNGQDLVKGADFREDVVNCVGAAAGFYVPQAASVIDVGGQSITSIALDEDGEVVNFMRNDKCASGSGRFLEMMAAKLGVGIGEIDAAVRRSSRVVGISSQCGVFAESEVITHVNNGEDKNDVMAGVCASVAKMVSAQGRRFGSSGVYTVTGGVANLDAVTRIVHEKLGGEFQRFPFNPQFAAAIGAALLGDAD